MQQRKAFTRYLTTTEERQLFAHLRSLAGVYAQRDLHWMIALRQTGVRVTAFSRLTCLDAREALRTGYLALAAEHAKGGHEHSVYLNRRARAAFTELLRLRRRQGHAEQAEAPLVVSRHGRALSVRSYQARMQRWCREAGLPVHASPHWWRHTLAKRLVAQSTAADPVGIVQGVLGHASRSSTGVYLMPDREDLARALEEAS